MFKTIAIPQNTSLHLEIPNIYVGKEIEILLFAKDELVEQKTKENKKLSDFTGVFSENDYQSLKLNTEKSRTEWNRDI